MQLTILQQSDARLHINHTPMPDAHFTPTDFRRALAVQLLGRDPAGENGLFDGQHTTNPIGVRQARDIIDLDDTASTSGFLVAYGRDVDIEIPYTTWQGVAFVFRLIDILAEKGEGEDNLTINTVGGRINSAILELAGHRYYYDFNLGSRPQSKKPETVGKREPAQQVSV